MLAQLQTDCDAYNTAHGTSLTLYQYQVLIYGKTMILSADDLASLQNSCGNCKYLLNDDIALPVFMDPGTKGCIVPADYSTAKSSLIAQFGGSLDTTNTNYQTIYASFMNQPWGFMLSYDQYKDYDAKLVGPPDAVLCNVITSTAPPTERV